MKILIIGSDKHYAIENFYLKYLREDGANVVQFAAQTIFHNHYYSSLLNKLFFKIGLSKIFNRINSEILEIAKSFAPDVVWIFKGMEVYPKTLLELKKQGITVANYNPDNPFVFSGKGSGNINITNSIGFYDIHLTYNKAIQAELESTTRAKVCYLPFGHDINDDLFKKVQQQNEVLKTCFLGNPDIYRADFLIKLAKRGIKIDVYGHSWSKFVNHPHIKTFQAVYDEEFWMTLYKYRVQLNLMRPHNEDSHNMRTFEVPGIGGIGLFPETPEHLDFFKKDMEVFMYRDMDECVNKINILLSLNKLKAMKIRIAARERSITSGYSYRDRAKYVFNILKKYTSN